VKYNQKLPVKVEKELDAYIERIKAIQWFKPTGVSKPAIDKQICVALKAFGIEATIEYRSLKTPEDWAAARDAARGAAWGAAWAAAWGAARGAAWDAAWGAAWGAARGAAWDAARGAAWDAARGAADLLASLTPKKLGYQEKYPQGNFLQLVPLWEAGLYPCGVIDGKFVCYVPEGGEALLEAELPAASSELEVIINGVTYVPRPGAGDAAA
jgi:hypothetical protein